MITNCVFSLVTVILKVLYSRAPVHLLSLVTAVMYMAWKLLRSLMRDF